jgi:hypothetical protein
VLNGRSIELVCQLDKDRLACSTVVTQNSDFDQAMGIQGRFGFFDDSWRQTISPDHDDGIQVVGIGAKDFALGRCELNLGHPRIIPARTQKNESQNQK